MRAQNIKALTLIQIIREIIKMFLHDSKNWISRIHNKQSWRNDEFKQNQNHLNVIWT